jgi:transcriptional regulator with XRE-family HTH domain
MKIEPNMITAARGLLGWSRDALAERSGVPSRTLDRLEVGKGSPRAKTLQAIQDALEAAGIEFLDGDSPGVRLKRKDAG